MYVINPQDISRLCLTRSLVHLRLSADDCLDTTMAVDRSSYHGHFYSDKAPGLSVAEIPVAQAVHLPLPTQWPWEYLSLWIIRISTTGVFFLAAAFMVGRVSEGLSPGFGGVSLVAFALGTLMAPFAAANFDHVPAGALGFAAFLLAWRRRPLLAGLAAGLGVFIEYEAAVMLVVVGAYVLLQGGWALLHYVRGALPGVALLWTYNWLAFGAPWHFSYRAIEGTLAASQSAGFFGIHLPRIDAVRQVFVGSGGLLVVSVVVVAGAAGLALLARRYGAEVVVCAAVALVFVVIESGYFTPYGGVSPGPRFLIPALPFVAVGFGPAFARWPRVAVSLAAASVIPTAALTLTWGSTSSVPGSAWAAVVHPLRLSHALAANALDWLGTGREFGAVVAGLAALVALAYSSSSIRSVPPATRSPS